MTPSEGTLDDLLQEERTFPPPEGFRSVAHVSDDAARETAARDPEQYWAGWAEELHWFRKWDESWTGIRRTPSGSTAVKSMRRTTASTVI